MGLSTTARADVLINATNFPDENFRNLDCQENSLTSLDLTGCPALYSVYIYENQINLNSMRDLINTIETTGHVSARAYDSTSETEGNVISAAQVAAFSAKKWHITYRPAVGAAWTTYGGMSDVAYDLWVNGTQVTSNNCNDIENLSQSGYDQGRMSYDEMTNTLTLDNAYIGATVDIGINDSIPGLTIQLIGESTLNMSDNDGLRHLLPHQHEEDRYNNPNHLLRFSGCGRERHEGFGHRQPDEHGAAQGAHLSVSRHADRAERSWQRGDGLLQ